MKKFLVILACVLLLFSMSVFAKTMTIAASKSNDFTNAVRCEGNIDWSKATSIITVNPLGLVFGYINAHYEIALNEMNGLGFNAGANFYNLSGWSWFGANVSGEYNWYFQKHALNGWFAGPVAGVSFVNINYEYTALDSSLALVTKKDSASSFGIQVGGHGGYRWIWDNGFTLDLQGGFMYTVSSAVTLGGATAPFGGFGPLLGVNLGYAW